MTYFELGLYEVLNKYAMGGCKPGYVPDHNVKTGKTTCTPVKGERQIDKWDNKKIKGTTSTYAVEDRLKRNNKYKRSNNYYVDTANRKLKASAIVKQNKHTNKTIKDPYTNSQISEQNDYLRNSRGAR